MITPIKRNIRHTKQANLLMCAVNGDIQSINSTFAYLSSTNPGLCKMMQETIHDLGDDEVWCFLLRYFATHRTTNHQNCDRRSDREASKRIDQAIIEVFSNDVNVAEVSEKEFVLIKGLDNTEPMIRKAAAYLAGLRGNQEAIPILGDIIKNDTIDWQMRAVKALAAVDDQACVPPLVMALTIDREILHREARRALHHMGGKAKAAWMELLQHPDSHIRWEAARGLGEIGDASAAPILAEGMLDENYAVRWATADVLGSLGEDAVPATLTILCRFPITEASRQAAYHALHGIADSRVQERIKLLVEALRNPAANASVPVVAHRLLMAWGK
jgi:hypothetical protein